MGPLRPMRGVAARRSRSQLALAFATGVSYADPPGHTTEEQTLGRARRSSPARRSRRSPRARARRASCARCRARRRSPGAAERRRSLAYFAQLTDFQLADEESPARVEFTDRGANAAFRPQEAFHPWAIDYSFRQLDQFTGGEPARAGRRRTRADGPRPPDRRPRRQPAVQRGRLGPAADRGRQPLTPNSGIKSDYSECRPENRAELLARETRRPDPRRADLHGRAGLRRPRLQGTRLLRPRRALRRPVRHLPEVARTDGPRAVSTFTPVGLRRGNTPVPTYLSNGNHDGLVQGNEDAIGAFEDIATGCFKVAQSTSTLPVGPNPTRTSSSRRHRLRRPARRAGPPLHRPRAAQARLLVGQPGATPTASPSSTRPS